MQSRLYDIVGIALDSRGDLYFVDKGSNRVRKIDRRTGVISTMAGVCRYGFDGDGKPAVKSMLHAPEAVIFDPSDNMYISDSMNHRMRKVDAHTGILTTVAGNGDSGYEDKNMGGCGMARFVSKEAAGAIKHGDGSLAVEAVVNAPVGLALRINLWLPSHRPRMPNRRLVRSCVGSTDRDLCRERSRHRAHLRWKELA